MCCTMIKYHIYSPFMQYVLINHAQMQYATPFLKGDAITADPTSIRFLYIIQISHQIFNSQSTLVHEGMKSQNQSL